MQYNLNIQKQIHIILCPKKILTPNINIIIFRKLAGGQTLCYRVGRRPAAHKKEVGRRPAAQKYMWAAERPAGGLAAGRSAAWRPAVRRPGRPAAWVRPPGRRPGGRKNILVLHNPTAHKITKIKVFKMKLNLFDHHWNILIFYAFKVFTFHTLRWKCEILNFESINYKTF